MSRRASFHVRAGFGAAFVLLVVPMLAACSQGPLKDDTVSTQISQPIAEVSVVATSGSVTVESWLGATINITRTLHYRGSSPPQTSANLLPGAILRVSYDCSGVPDCSVDTKVQVPFQKTVTVHTSSGAVTLDGLRGRTNAVSSSGALTLTNVEGDLDVESSSGAVSGTGLASTQANVRVTSGAVSLQYAQPPTSVTVRSASGAITLKVPEGPYRVTATSTSGALQVDVPNDASASRTIDVTSTSGSITITK